MYKFTVNIGKEGRQALRQLEFALDYSRRDHPEHHLSKLRDCVNLQRLHIGLDHWMIKDLQLFNIYKNKDKKIDIWEWKGQGEQTWGVLCQLPRGLELKIREVNSFQSPDAKISTFFEGLVGHDGVVEKYEAELKENLRCLREGQRRAAVEGQMKRRRAHR